MLSFSLQKFFSPLFMCFCYCICLCIFFSFVMGPGKRVWTCG